MPAALSNLVVLAATGVATALSLSPAFAADTFKVFFDPSLGSFSSNGPTGTGVTGEATFTFTGVGNAVSMAMDLKNTSTAPITASRFVGIGLQLPSDVTFLSYTPSSTFDAVVTDGTLPPLGSFAICVTAANPDCLASGSPNDGLANGASATPAGTFSLSSTTLVGSTAFRDAFVSLFENATFNPFAARFKAIAGGRGGSDKLTGVLCTEANGCLPPPPPAPGDSVPGPLPVLGAAAAFGFSRRLRYRIKSSSVKV
ncbi:cistern family PEP-CTERM protein [Cyanobium sp. Candia 9D4]|jgi:hypothetical protein|nr:cistern family PEP-CTERM protein [Cyanobium sp. Candia 9D4]